MLSSGHGMVTAHTNSQELGSSAQVEAVKNSTTWTGWAPEVYTYQGAIGSEGCWERESHFSWGRGNWKIASVPVENNSRPRTYAYTGSTNWTWGLDRWLSSQSECSLFF